VDSTHIVKIRPLGSPQVGDIVHAHGGPANRIPRTLTAPISMPACLAKMPSIQRVSSLEEKRTGTRRAEYQSDGTGKVTAIP